jgi:hypothetical protein
MAKEALCPTLPYHGLVWPTVIAMFLLPFLPEWVFHGPRTIKHGHAGMYVVTAEHRGLMTTPVRLYQAMLTLSSMSSFGACNRQLPPLLET